MSTRAADEKPGRLTPEEVLRQRFGYTSFRPHQRDIIQSALDGKDSLILMLTSGGKSLCFQVPMLTRPGLGIVISPLISLIQDQVETLKTKGVAAATLNSTQSREQIASIVDAVRRDQLSILYVSPERFVLPAFRRLIAGKEISLFAIDEAHCVDKWGATFRESYLRLAEVMDAFPAVPRMAVTATADLQTRANITHILKLRSPDVHLAGFNRPNISISITQQSQEPWRQLAQVISARQNRTGIIYRASRSKVEETCEELKKFGIRALPYHAGLPQSQREETQRIFMNDPHPLIVATIAFGMGVDRADTRYVIHLDPPGSVEAYYQEIGRGGRDGRPCEALMMYSENALTRRRRIILDDEDSPARTRSLREHDAVATLLHTPECRRMPLLKHFGERHDGRCSACDRCLSTASSRPSSDLVALLLRTMIGTGQQFGATYLTQVLTGDKTAKLRGTGHQDLPEFGKGAHLPAKEWRSVIRQVSALGLIGYDYTAPTALMVTPDGYNWLKNPRDIALWGDWSDVKPISPSHDGLRSPLRASGRNSLPGAIIEKWQGLLNAMAHELRSGSVTQTELASILEALPEGEAQILTLTSNPAIRERATEISVVLSQPRAGRH